MVIGSLRPTVVAIIILPIGVLVPLRLGPLEAF
jgi:hypothetical protein